MKDSDTKCDNKNVTKSAKLENGETYSYFDINPDKGYIIIFVHGFATNKEIWMSLLTLLYKKNYILIVPDIRGHGKSSYENSVKDPSDFVKDLNYLLNVIGVTKVHTLIDWSMRGAIATRFAIDYPSCVQKLVLYSCVLIQGLPIYSAPDEGGKVKRLIT